jgi:hypothetical protein
MSPMSQVKVTTSTKSAYCERSGISPQRIAPRDVAPRPIEVETTTATIVASTASTW